MGPVASEIKGAKPVCMIVCSHSPHVTWEENSNKMFRSTSDNGAQLPFARWNLYGAGIRLPFAASWPGVVKAGGSSSAMLHFTSVLPTFLELPGVRFRVAHGPITTARCAVRTLRFIRWRRRSRWPRAAAVIRRYHEHPAEELYDIGHDPFELENLAGTRTHRRTVGELRGKSTPGCPRPLAGYPV